MDASLDTDSAFAPRIYYLPPHLLGPLDGWRDQIERIAALGFDHLLIAPPFLTGRANDIFVTRDHQRLHPALSDDRHAEAWLRELADLAHAHGMALMLDVSVTRIGTDAGLLHDHPSWFLPPGGPERRIDPRTDTNLGFVAPANFADPEAADHLVGWWSGQLQRYARAGVVGFRFDDVRGVAAHHWRRLAAAVREKHPLQRFLAWTPGLARHELTALQGAGFDAVFSSSRWWDSRADWLVAEHAALARVGAPIAFPETPFGPRLARDMPDVADQNDTAGLERAYKRAFQIAVGTGAGCLVPMGFEFGLSEPFSRLAGTREPGQHDEPVLADAAHSPPPLLEAVRRAQAAPRFDLSADIAALNTLSADAPVLAGVGTLTPLSGPDASATAVLRTPGNDPRVAPCGLLLLINPDLHWPALATPATLLNGIPGEFTLFAPLAAVTSTTPRTGAGAEDAARPDAVPLTNVSGYAPLAPLRLAPGEMRLLAARRLPAMAMLEAATQATAPAAAPPVVRGADTVSGVALPRIAIESVTPVVDDGRFPAKRVVGEFVEVEADIFMDGHDKIAANVLWRERPNGDSADPVWSELPMQPIGNDRWSARIPLLRLGAYEFTVQAWRDTFASLVDHIVKKRKVGQDVGLEIEEARLYFESLLKAAPSEPDAASNGGLRAWFQTFERASADDRLALLLAPEAAQAVRATRQRDFAVRYDATPVILAERSAARFANWYELFPRSQSGDPARHGTFIDVISRLPDIGAMGFDVLYFPPIHPIGLANRKGPNNTLTPGPHDVGSPYAIGAAEGGHTAIHPELGSFDDFKRLMAAAAKHGLELALDFAIQCSPDHPWLTSHPTWFAWRPDGTLRYAENPPKKYQDIVNPDFYAPDAIPQLWLDLRDVILFWIGTGVRIFRVDNPHTKPLPFWEWMIGEVQRRHPEVIFLSEAFTRPKLMNRLAKVGFTQSYTYFTWRESKQDFVEYLTELTQTDARDYFRPNFFVNTPDINPRFLQRSGRAGFVIRAALAATLAGVWGVYSGFELCESAALPNSEEYQDSEKYQIRVWDWHRPGNIIDEITLLNRLRRANPALQTHLGITFLPSSNPNVLFFEKATPTRDNVLLIAIALVPDGLQESQVEMPLWRWKLGDGEALRAVDLVSNESMILHGKHQTIRLDPHVMPFAIRRVVPANRLDVPPEQWAVLDEATSPYGAAVPRLAQDMNAPALPIPAAPADAAAVPPLKTPAVKGPAKKSAVKGTAEVSTKATPKAGTKVSTKTSTQASTQASAKSRPKAALNAAKPSNGVNAKRNGKTNTQAGTKPDENGDDGSDAKPSGVVQ